jgi:hypothetical protein
VTFWGWDRVIVSDVAGVTSCEWDGILVGDVAGVTSWGWDSVTSLGCSWGD